MSITEYLSRYSPKWAVRALLRSPYMDGLRESYPGLPDDEVAYLYCNGLTERPTCRHCQGGVKWHGNRYAKACSTRCNNQHRDEAQKAAFALTAREAAKAPDRAAKIAATNAQRYGGHPMQGKKHAPRTEMERAAIVEKITQTNMERYGVGNIGQHAPTRNKVEMTRSRNRAINASAADERLAQKITQRVHPEETLLGLVPPGTGEANRRYRISCKCGYTDDYASETFKFRMRLAGRVCSKCCGITTGTSFAETQIAALFPEAQTNNRKIIAPLELDILLEGSKTAIEYCGLYWHSELANTPRGYHRRKYDLCTSAGYRLITIFEDEWTNRRATVESMLGHLTGRTTKRISARKCQVECIDSRTGNAFVEGNHIQGRGRAKHYYGLRYQGQLVAVMSFSNSEISRRSVGWDINRFCTLGGTSVVGAAGKLFAAFVRDHNPDRVISYADLRWGTGAVYGKLGFVHVTDTPPNYWYFRDGEVRRRHRYGLRKNSTDDASKTEWENRQAQGWNRIWDCGHAKWVWDRKDLNTP